MQNIKLDYAKSPFADHNGISILSVENDHCVVQMEITEHSLNRSADVHGGALMTLADTACGVTARLDHRNYVTQNLNMHFMKNVSFGTLHAKASVISRGNTITVINVEILTPEKTLLACATATMFCIGKPSSN